MGDESAARITDVAWAKEVFRRMAEGHSVCTPAYFDEMMADFGLTPADIDTPPDAIAAAAIRWPVLWVKEVFCGMAEGDPDCSPDYFDGAMAKLGLSPTDIGATAETIATAKCRWNMTQKPPTADEARRDLDDPATEAFRRAYRKGRRPTFRRPRRPTFRKPRGSEPRGLSDD